MGYDEAIAARFRVLVSDRTGVTEQKMFGGLAFLVGGHMAVAASGRGGIMVRVDPDDGARLLRETPAEPMEMRGRTMTGWLRVAADRIADDDALREWVERGTTYAGALPPK